jgi:hypothetical protein
MASTKEQQDRNAKKPQSAPKLSANELERVTEVFKMYETGLREATIYPKVSGLYDGFICNWRTRYSIVAEVGGRSAVVSWGQSTIFGRARSTVYFNGKKGKGRKALFNVHLSTINPQYGLSSAVACTSIGVTSIYEALICGAASSCNLSTTTKTSFYKKSLCLTT